jgi:hypothetical protein
MLTGVGSSPSPDPSLISQHEQPAVRIPPPIEVEQMHWRRASLLVALAGMLGGCISITSETQTPGPLPAPSIPTILSTVCRQVKISGVLQSDPADPHVAWLATDQEERIEVVWPMGYRAQWNTFGDQPWLEVYDTKGRLFMTTTDIPSARHVCDAGRPGTVLLMQTDP